MLSRFVQAKKEDLDLLKEPLNQYELWSLLPALGARNVLALAREAIVPLPSYPFVLEASRDSFGQALWMELSPVLSTLLPHRAQEVIF